MARVNVPFVQGQIDLDLQNRSLRRANHNWQGASATGGSIAYGEGDVVVHANQLWVALRANDNVEPTEANSSDWRAISAVGGDGMDGEGWTGGSYDSNTGIVTFTSDDGLGFMTGDLRGATGPAGTRGADGAPGTNGRDGTDGADGTDGRGWTSGSYSATTGVVTFASDDGLGFETGDLRGAAGAAGAQGPQGQTEIFWYRRADSIPSTPTSPSGPTTTIDSVPTGWFRSPPSSGGANLYFVVVIWDPATSSFGTPSGVAEVGSATAGPQGPQGPAGSDGADGTDGTDGQGWTGGSYDANTGIVTFTSDDGLGFVTGDLRGADGADGAAGRDGTDGTNGADGQTGPQGPQGLTEVFWYRAAATAPDSPAAPTGSSLTIDSTPTGWSRTPTTPSAGEALYFVTSLWDPATSTFSTPSGVGEVTGNQGPRGPQGPQGEQGPAGMDGATVDPAKSGGLGTFRGGLFQYYLPGAARFESREVLYPLEVFSIIWTNTAVPGDNTFRWVITAPADYGISAGWYIVDCPNDTATSGMFDGHPIRTGGDGDEGRSSYLIQIEDHIDTGNSDNSIIVGFNGDASPGVTPFILPQDNVIWRVSNDRLGPVRFLRNDSEATADRISHFSIDGDYFDVDMDEDARQWSVSIDDAHVVSRIENVRPDTYYDTRIDSRADTQIGIERPDNYYDNRIDSRSLAAVDFSAQLNNSNRTYTISGNNSSGTEESVSFGLAHHNNRDVGNIVAGHGIRVDIDSAGMLTISADSSDTPTTNEGSASFTFNGFTGDTTFTDTIPANTTWNLTANWDITLPETGGTPFGAVTLTNVTAQATFGGQTLTVTPNSPADKTANGNESFSLVLPAEISLSRDRTQNLNFTITYDFVEYSDAQRMQVRHRLNNQTARFTQPITERVTPPVPDVFYRGFTTLLYTDTPTAAQIMNANIGDPTGYTVGTEFDTAANTLSGVMSYVVAYASTATNLQLQIFDPLSNGFGEIGNFRTYTVNIGGTSYQVWVVDSRSEGRFSRMAGTRLRIAEV